MNTKQSISEQFSKEHLSAVLEAMIRVKGGEIDEYGLGICWNSQCLCDEDTYEVVAEFSLRWSKHSGRECIPIKYTHGEDMWTGKSGQLRYELLDFLIDELTKAVENYDNEH